MTFAVIVLGDFEAVVSALEVVEVVEVDLVATGWAVIEVQPAVIVPVKMRITTRYRRTERVRIGSRLSEALRASIKRQSMQQPGRSTSRGREHFCFSSCSIFADLLMGGSRNGISIRRQFGRLESGHESASWHKTASGYNSARPASARCGSGTRTIGHPGV